MDQAGLARDCNLLSLDAQRRRIYHLVAVSDCTLSLFAVRPGIGVDDRQGALQLGGRRRIGRIDDLDLRWVNRPLPIEAQLGTEL